MNTLIYYKRWLLIVLAIVAGMGIRAFGQDTIMYHGGYADGHAGQSLIQYLPVKLSHYMVYNGGNGDGYSMERATQFSPTVLPQSVMYKGGAGDGNTTLEDHHFNRAYLSHYNLYAGSAGDGYSYMDGTAFNRALLDQYNMYAGGSGDGYAGHLAVSYVPLPVHLLSFTGEMTTGNHSLLAWKVADEQDALRYELEKSSDSRSFRNIYTRVVSNPSTGPVAYQYEDRQPREGANYYRLRIFDKDGSNRLSNVVLLFYKNEQESLTLFPNPATTSLNIGYRSAVAATLRLVDMKGAVLHTQAIAAGNQTFSIPVNGIAAGAYLLHVLYDNGQHKTIRFVKSN